VSSSHFAVDGGNPDPVVIATGEIDLAVREELREVLAPLAGVVTIDLSDVTFVDSSAIGVLVSAHKRLAEQGGSLRLRNPRDMPRRALEIVGLADWIDD
jgi:anti-sigma B factor antagonist